MTLALALALELSLVAGMAKPTGPESDGSPWVHRVALTAMYVQSSSSSRSAAGAAACLEEGAQSTFQWALGKPLTSRSITAGSAAASLRQQGGVLPASVTAAPTVSGRTQPPRTATTASSMLPPPGTCALSFAAAQPAKQPERLSPVVCFAAFRAAAGRAVGGGAGSAVVLDEPMRCVRPPQVAAACNSKVASAAPWRQRPSWSKHAASTAGSPMVVRHANILRTGLLGLLHCGQVPRQRSCGWSAAASPWQTACNGGATRWKARPHVVLNPCDVNPAGMVLFYNSSAKLDLDPGHPPRARPEQREPKCRL